MLHRLNEYLISLDIHPLAFYITAISVVVVVKVASWKESKRPLNRNVGSRDDLYQGPFHNEPLPPETPPGAKD